MNKPQKITPFKHFCLSVGVIPSAYTDAMTYYELLEWLCKFLQENVIPTVNNNSEVVTELQDYVTHYFDNLDVQEEINNKLDDMAETGVLEEIIASYLNSKAIFGFDNVASMKASTNLISGSYARTLGYYTISDNGGATYKVRPITNEDVVDNFQIIPLADNTLIAELIVGDYITPEMAGCYGDNEHDDTTNLQKAINTNYKIKTKNQYKISDTIEILNTFEMDSNSFIHLTSDFGNDKLGVAVAHTDSQQINKIYTINVDAHGYGICGIGLDRPKKCKCKFYVKNAGISGISLNYFGRTGNNENQFDCHVNGNTSGTTENGVIVNCYDSTFSDIITVDCKYGVLLDHGQLCANNVHSWLSSDTMATLWNDSAVIKATGSYNCNINWLYQDTVKYGIVGNNGFKGEIRDFEFNCINESTYYQSAKQINITGTIGIVLTIENFTNDIELYHLLTYTVPTSNVNVFGVTGRNGANPYYQSSNSHTTFTDANDAPQLGSKYVSYSVANLPMSSNGILESEVVGNIVIQRYYAQNISNEYPATKKYYERYRKLGDASFSAWYLYQPYIES